MNMKGVVQLVVNLDYNYKDNSKKLIGVVESVPFFYERQLYFLDD